MEKKEKIENLKRKIEELEEIETLKEKVKNLENKREDPVYVPTSEPERERESSGGGWVVLIIIVLLAIGVGIFFYSNSEARENICGTHTEKYTDSSKGCDRMANCRCLHESWGGLGACDSCECTKEVSNC